jgi:sugar phosphate isomerase/epimerase
MTLLYPINNLGAARGVGRPGRTTRRQWLQQPRDALSIDVHNVQLGSRPAMKTRRQWLRIACAGLAASLHASARAQDPRRGCTLSIGTYGMRGLGLERAVGMLADVGYDGVEIAVAPGYDGEPAQLAGDRRRDLRRLLAERRLTLTALMENLPPEADEARHRGQLQRLQRVLELARDLDAPLVQTVLGSGAWQDKRELFRDRLGAWLALARAARVSIAIKPHRGGAMSRPEEAIWLIRQLGEPPQLRLVYDYSHYAFRDMPLEDTVRTALPFMAHVAVKDAVEREGRVQFLLPGAGGGFDYARLLRLLHAGGYRGDICCEVSSMVSSQAGYEPRAAAAACYRHMAGAFDEARVPRQR